MIIKIPFRVSDVSGPLCSNCGCLATEHYFEVTMQLSDEYQVQYLTIPGVCQNWKCKKICLRYDMSEVS